MNQITPERRSRERSKQIADVTLIAGDSQVAAKLEDISFAGLRCRTAPRALDQLMVPLDGVKLEDLPALRVTVARQDGDAVALTYANPDLAGRVVAGFLQLHDKG